MCVLFYICTIFAPTDNEMLKLKFVEVPKGLEVDYNHNKKTSMVNGFCCVKSVGFQT